MRLLLGLTLVVGVSAFLPYPAPRSARVSGAWQLAASKTSKDKPLSWQESLELLLSPTTPLAQRQVLLQNVVSRTSDIRRDVEEALKQGDVDPLLTPGLQAVRRQLSEDIIPQLASEPEQAAKAILGEIPKIAQRSIESLPKNPKDLADAVREISTTLPSEARNVFLRTPEGLETPSFSLLAETEEYQIRRYDPYTVIYTDMATDTDGPVIGSPAATGSAFNTLASYIFGDNTQGESMAMTTPVEIRKDSRALYNMRFVVPSKYTTETAPRPSSPRVRLTTTPQETLAAKEFPGFATDGEVRRQLVALLSALEADGIEIVDPSSYRVLQYNPPYTLPWLRRNEIMVEVSYGGADQPAVEEVVAVDKSDEAGDDDLIGTDAPEAPDE